MPTTPALKLSLFPGYYNSVRLVNRLKGCIYIRQESSYSTVNLLVASLRGNTLAFSLVTFVALIKMVIAFVRAYYSKDYTTK